MSPEQLAGEPVTPASDQFGLAVTLVELITGARPFAGDTPWATMEAIRAGDAQLDGLEGDVEHIVRRALKPRSADRFATVDEFRVALAEVARMRAREGVNAGTAELADAIRLHLRQR
jgi:eukaryotic-like serine/threonine-protein kinase